MYRGLRINVIIPALDEEETIAAVLGAIDDGIVDQVVVADNGSRDDTAARARAAGAMVVHEERRGYGSACLRAIATAPPADVIVFVDGDCSDDAAEIPLLLDALVDNEAEIAIGSRVLGEAEPGALTPVQIFGNALTCRLVRWLWGVDYTDLGPFRAIRQRTYDILEMMDPDFGWTIEMQVKAAQRGITVVEVPVSYRRRRGGRSKVSGTLAGSWGAGRRILGYVLAAKLAELKQHWRGSPAPAQSLTRPSPRKLLVFSRYPRAGEVKTRLVPVLGRRGAAELHRRLAAAAIDSAQSAARSADLELEIHATGGSDAELRAWLGPELSYHQQSEGDLGARLAGACAAAFASGATAVVVMGSDCPQLSSAIITEAFAKLAECDLVLGPARDGGYYLIGLRRSRLQLFAGIDWGTDLVLEQTLTAARRLGLDTQQLVVLDDVDRPADLDLARSFLGETDSGRETSTTAT